MGWFRKSRKRPASSEKEELWTVCPHCAAHIFKQEWSTNLQVCPKCNYHSRLTFKERLNLLVDAGTFSELNADVTTSDPLGFVDAKGSYAEKAQQAKAAAKEVSQLGSTMTCSPSFSSDLADPKNVPYYFMAGPTYAAMGEILALTANGTLAPVVDKVFSFDDAPKAHQYIHDRKNFGKVLLIP